MRLLGVLGGESIGCEALAAWVEASDIVVAADAGIHHLEGISIVPHRIVGDMDSALLVQEYDQNLITIDEDEHRSDLEKLLTAAQRFGVDQVVLICIHGGRMDHFLASFSASIACGLNIRWVLPREHVVLLRPGFQGVFSTGPAKRISLIPLEGVCSVKSQGLRWELAHTSLAVGQHVSLSNESTADAITLQVSGGHLALMVEQLPSEVPPW
ncbi:MAG: thiamine diphosphokinase [Fimbriimonadaceae bacterium]|nr:thiamine diphosphokinase [Fimbriimonadaceae bacterium]